MEQKGTFKLRPRDTSVEEHYRVLANLAAGVLRRSWFGRMFEPGAQMYMARLLFGVYAAYEDGLLVSKKEAMEYMGALHGNTSKRYMAMAQEHGLIEILASTTDKRVDRVVPTQRLGDVVQAELRLWEEWLRVADSRLNTMDGPADGEATKELVEDHSVFTSNIALIRRLTETIQIIPTHRRAYEQRIGCYLWDRNWAGIIEDCTALIKMFPEDARYYAWRADAYRQVGHRDARKFALSDYTKAIELDPMNDRWYCERAKCLEQDKMFSLALRDYDRAVRFTSGEASSAIYVAKGDLHQTMGNEGEAIKDMRSALKAWPGNPTAKSRLRGLLAIQRAKASAGKSFRRKHR